MSAYASALKRFDEAPICFVATAGDNGPNVVPVGFKWVHEGRLLIADIFFGKTRNNLGDDCRIAIAIGSVGPKAGLQFKGDSHVHRTGPIYDLVVAKLKDEGVALPLHAAISVDVTEVYELEPGPNAGRQLDGHQS